MPDITIESCKSLIEGISKTILKKLNVSYSEEGRNIDAPRDLIKKFFDELPDHVFCDAELATRTADLVIRMSEIRNKRGDISHGRLSPKEVNSDTRLAEFTIHITDAIICYLLEIYFSSDLSYLEGTKYENNAEFNSFLDENNKIDGILYSRALFDQDLVSYEEKLKNYLYNEDVSN